MAQLTPLAKGLISVIVLGVAGSLAWNFGLKDRFGGGGEPAASRPAAANSGAPTETMAKAKPGAVAKAAQADDKNAPLGSPTNPLRVSLVSFHGYAPALVANGNALNTQPGSIYHQKGCLLYTSRCV